MTNEITCEVNGKLMRIPKGSSIADLKAEASVPGEETLAETSHARAVGQRDGDEAKPGSKYRSIPVTVEG